STRPRLPNVRQFVERRPAAFEPTIFCRKEARGERTASALCAVRERLGTAHKAAACLEMIHVEWKMLVAVGNRASSEANGSSGPMLRADEHLLRRGILPSN